MPSTRALKYKSLNTRLIIGKSFEDVMIRFMKAFKDLL